ncbi:hypothetical protein AMJ96_CH02642 [Rhizobium sp. N113]|uniref:hypothetical protein n=1 Tax=unclassified Rhizobium TaxID=2613769 RepID=UPI0007EBD09E|nr:MULTISPECIES: hypothetical protein [unclassified Rhizobium]ANL10291.1 hypothetical protein AMJ98_CH02635 [Rhizobium sp. N1341]ANL22343.1 hypothetical protein AMJ96_CH02642 [Rhizobium sp. N113]ANM41117.1 hypothetical protein AMK03_CH02628 [Rhizobium sp. N741]
MGHSEFQIGLEFWCEKSRWRCTDVGTRTVVALRIHPVEITTVQADGTKKHETLTYEQADAMGWFDGPPYRVAEVVFDEDDLEVCSLERKDL